MKSEAERVKSQSQDLLKQRVYILDAFMQNYEREVTEWLQAIKAGCLLGKLHVAANWNDSDRCSSTSFGVQALELALAVGFRAQVGYEMFRLNHTVNLIHKVAATADRFSAFSARRPGELSFEQFRCFNRLS